MSKKREFLYKFSTIQQLSTILSKCRKNSLLGWQMSENRQFSTIRKMSELPQQLGNSIQILHNEANIHNIEQMSIKKPIKFGKCLETVFLTSKCPKTLY